MSHGRLLMWSLPRRISGEAVVIVAEGGTEQPCTGMGRSGGETGLGTRDGDLTAIDGGTREASWNPVVRYGGSVARNRGSVARGSGKLDREFASFAADVAR